MVLHPTVDLKAKLSRFSASHEENRNNLREIVVNCFMKEKAGHGKGDETSKYKYVVEKLASGKRIYLTRPVPLNKGFDFIIHVEDHTFSNRKDNPRHTDIFEDLKAKKQEDETKFSSLLQALQDIFMCQDPDDILPTYRSDLNTFRQGLPPELILKVVKWFFIEQDIRYWNWSGRNMFINGIRDL